MNHKYAWHSRIKVTDTIIQYIDVNLKKKDSFLKKKILKIICFKEADACEKSKESYRKYRSRLANESSKATQKSTSQPPSSRR